jgi:hypothetical protein
MEPSFTIGKSSLLMNTSSHATIVRNSYRASKGKQPAERLAF